MAISSGQSYFYGKPENVNKLVSAGTDPYGTDIFKRQAQSALQMLQPQQQAQQQGLMDMFRGAGNLSSGIFGGSLANLLGQQGAQQQKLLSDIGGQIPSQIAGLLNALKLSTQQQTSEFGGGGGGGMEGFNLNEDPYWQSLVQSGQTNPFGGGGGAGGFGGGGGAPSGGGFGGGGGQAPQGGNAGYWTTSPDGSVMQGAGGEIYVNGVYQGNVSDPNMGGGTSPLEQAGWGTSTGYAPEAQPLDPLSNYITNYGLGFENYDPFAYSDVDLSGWDFGGF